jgi:phospholipid-transporting ATPase
LGPSKGGLIEDPASTEVPDTDSRQFRTIYINRPYEPDPSDTGHSHRRGRQDYQNRIKTS